MLSAGDIDFPMQGDPKYAGWTWHMSHPTSIFRIDLEANFDSKITENNKTKIVA